MVRNKKIDKILQAEKKNGDREVPSMGDDVSKTMKTNAHGTGSQCRRLAKTKESRSRLTWKSEAGNEILSRKKSLIRIYKQKGHHCKSNIWGEIYLKGLFKNHLKDRKSETQRQMREFSTVHTEGNKRSTLELANKSKLLIKRNTTPLRKERKQ